MSVNYKIYIVFEFENKQFLYSLLMSKKSFDVIEVFDEYYNFSQ